MTNFGTDEKKYTNEDLNSAIEAGIFSEEQVAAFRAQIIQQNTATFSVDEEHFRFISGFNDIFIVIACALLLVSIWWIGADFKAVLGPLFTAVTAWVLAEYFTRVRHMALPSIVLLAAFVIAVFYAGFTFFISPQLKHQEAEFALISAITGLATWLHWLRFRVPITVAAGTSAVVGTLLGLFVSAFPWLEDRLNLLLFFAGVIVFGLAMRWDLSDLKRTTRRTDVAFWLHLLAAPLLVHPIFSSLDVIDSNLSQWQVAIVAVLYLAIALISISIDRRAMMVSALAYVLYAFSNLFEQFGVISLNFALTAFLIGSGLLMLSAFWSPVRTTLIHRYPNSLRRFERIDGTAEIC